jgi:hypothetical protein
MNNLSMNDIPYTPSPREIAEAKTPNGGWTRRQLAAWGVPWPPPDGWKKALEEKWLQGA